MAGLRHVDIQPRNKREAPAWSFDMVQSARALFDDFTRPYNKRTLEPSKHRFLYSRSFQESPSTVLSSTIYEHSSPPKNQTMGLATSKEF